MYKDAVISDDKKYRYSLSRIWDKSKSLVLFIGLNPSTADACLDDPTITKCINYAKRWGYGGILMANLFAYRATNPAELFNVDDPIGKENDMWISKLQKQADLIVCVWGVSGTFQNRNLSVIKHLDNPHCLTILKDGQPGHPLYKKSDLKPKPYIY